MTRYLIATSILVYVFLCGITAGMSYLEDINYKRSEQCLAWVLDDDTDLHKFFGHHVAPHDLYVHAESKTALFYVMCMNRR